MSVSILVGSRSMTEPLTPPSEVPCLPRNAIRLMIGQAAARFGVTPTDVLGDRRLPAIAAARQAVMWNLRARGYSLERIGRLLKRDRTTVQHGVEAYERRGWL